MLLIYSSELLLITEHLPCYHSDLVVFIKVVECTAKKPSRKTRRRSGKLAEEYGRRSERCRWLETHIWHAKRFKMIEYHGYKIAGRCCDKGARATYRYLHTGCLLYVSLIIAHYKIHSGELKHYW